LKKIILFSLSVSICFFGFSQNEKFIDSISIKIKTDKSDSIRASTYYSAAKYSLYNMGDLKLFRSYIDSSMQFSKRSKREGLEATNHFLYGLLERLEGNYDKALDHLEINIKYFENDSTNKSYALFQKGVIYQQLGDYNKSLKTYLDILEIFEAKKDSFAIASTLNSIAIIYENMDDHDQAIANFNDAKKIFILKDIQRDICNTDISIAAVYYKKGDYEKSRIYAQNSLKLSRSINFKQLEGKSLQILGDIAAKTDPKLGLKYYLEAKEILSKTNFEREKLSLSISLGIAYYEQKNYAKAKNELIGALKVAEEKKIKNQVKETSFILAKIAAIESDFSLAYNYRLKYTEAKDSIINIENSKNINLLQKQFETEKKDKEITEQKLIVSDQQLSLQKSKSKSRLMTILIIALLLASILLWFVFRQRQKRIQQQLVAIQKEQEVQTLESLIEGEEKERLRIAKELHDGVNGDLSAIKYKLSSLLKMNNEVINEAVNMIDNSCKQVRAISHNLVPPSLKDFNLIEAVNNYCENMNSIHAPEINFQHIGDPITLNKKVEVNIFRIIQELVTNAVKHSEAKTIDVQLSNRKDTVLVTVEDNGKGYTSNKEDNAGIGLNNIKSRVEYLNANLDIVSNTNGTSNTIEIDLNKILTK